VKWLS